MRGSPHLTIGPLFLRGRFPYISLKYHNLAVFWSIYRYFDLLRFWEKCGGSPHPAKTVGLVSLRRRIPQIWGIQSPETSEILNAHSNYKLSHLTYAHVFTNTRPHDCAIIRVQRQRTSPSTQRFPNSKAYIHRVLQVFHSVFRVPSVLIPQNT